MPPSVATVAVSIAPISAKQNGLCACLCLRVNMTTTGAFRYRNRLVALRNDTSASRHAGTFRSIRAIAERAVSWRVRTSRILRACLAFADSESAAGADRSSDSHSVCLTSAGSASCGRGRACRAPRSVIAPIDFEVLTRVTAREILNIARYRLPSGNTAAERNIDVCSIITATGFGACLPFGRRARGTRILPSAIAPAVSAARRVGLTSLRLGQRNTAAGAVGAAYDSAVIAAAFSGARAGGVGRAG